MNPEDEIAEIVRLAGIPEASGKKLQPLQVVTIFDAGSVDEMRDTLKRYKAASGDQSPSHIFVIGDQIYAANAVVARDWKASPWTAEDSAAVTP